MGKTNRKVKCPYCDAVINAQGLGGHAFIKHGIRLSKQTLDDQSLTPERAERASKPLNDNAYKRLTGVDTKIHGLAKRHNNGNRAHVQSELPECQRPDGKRLYTEDDLWQLFGKLARAVYHEDSSNLLSILATYDKREQLIREFETKFQCKFADAKKLFSHIRPEAIYRGSDDYGYRRSDGKRIG